MYIILYATFRKERAHFAERGLGDIRVSEKKSEKYSIVYKTYISIWKYSIYVNNNYISNV